MESLESRLKGKNILVNSSSSLAEYARKTPITEEELKGPAFEDVQTNFSKEMQPIFFPHLRREMSVFMPYLTAMLLFY